MDTATTPTVPVTERVERRGVSRTRWAAIGASVAVSLGGGTLALVTAAPTTPVVTGGDFVPYPESSYFVPITPCRLFDTRPLSTVGSRSTPVGPAEVFTVDVTGTIGYYGLCNLPLGVTAILVNITAVSPSANSFLTVYPSDVARPNASNLNFVAGQPATANLVNVKLPTLAYKATEGSTAAPVAPATQSFNIYNDAGTVHVIGDIAGYYLPALIPV